MRFRPEPPNIALPWDATTPDCELAAAARRGGREAFDALVDRYADRLFRFLRMRAPSAGVAEELVQDTFVQCWRTLLRFDPTRSFSTWIFKLGSNLAATRVRRERTRTATVLGEQAAGPDPAQVVCARDARDNIWDVVHAALAPEARTSLWLFYGEDKSAAEIAEILGKSEGAVRVLLLRSRTRLATILRKDALSLETR